MKKWVKIKIEDVLKIINFEDDDDLDYFVDYHKNSIFYKYENNNYPLLKISINTHYTYPNNYIISINRKDDEDGWWYECGFYKELIPDLIDLLKNLSS